MTTATNPTLDALMSVFADMDVRLAQTDPTERTCSGCGEPVLWWGPTEGDVRCTVCIDAEAICMAPTNDDAA